MRPGARLLTEAGTTAVGPLQAGGQRTVVSCTRLRKEPVVVVLSNVRVQVGQVPLLSVKMNLANWKPSGAFTVAVPRLNVSALADSSSSCSTSGAGISVVSCRVLRAAVILPVLLTPVAVSVYCRGDKRAEQG